MCLMRSKYRPEMTLDRDLSPTWWWDSLEKTVSGRQEISSAWRSHQLVYLSKAVVSASHALHRSSHSEPTDAPTDLRISKVHSTSVHVYWKPVDLKSVRGEFKEYRVSFPLKCFLTGRSSGWLLRKSPLRIWERRTNKTTGTVFLLKTTKGEPAQDPN